MRAEEIQKWVDENYDHYVNLMRLSDWYLKVLIIDRGHSLTQKQNKEAGFYVAGDCTTRYQYKSATVRLYAENILDVQHLDRTFVHELAHVATSCVNIYTNYVAKNLFPSYIETANKVRSDVLELLALQIEMIICGKSKNYSRILHDEKYIAEKSESLCRRIGVFVTPKIISSKQPSMKTAQEIVEEEKKDDPDYWFEKWREANKRKEKTEGAKSDNKTSESASKETEKKIYMPPQKEHLSKDYAERLFRETRALVANGQGSIVLNTDISSVKKRG